jgi:hypothetical protein
MWAHSLYSTLKMERVRSSEKLVKIYEITPHNILENSNISYFN